MKLHRTLVSFLLLSLSPVLPMSAGIVDSLMTVMTLDEKIGQLNLPAGGNIVTGEVQHVEMENLIDNGKMGGFFNVKGFKNIMELQRRAVENGPHGIPLLVGADVVHGYETIFPIPLALSSSWNPEAIETMARISAIEATADGVNWNFSPMVDICTDPRWGRIAEGAGEDSYLGSELAKAYVRGYQGTDLKAPSTMMACVKHFALYGGAEGGRDYAPVDMSREKMFNYYLNPYKASVDAGCGSVMTSFNLVNGTHATADDRLINGVLRGKWGFDGLIVTDYNSLPEVATLGTSDWFDAGAKALKSGTDMDMVSAFFIDHLNDALRRGLVTEADIDRACRRVLEAKEKLGLFDDPYRYCDPRRSTSEIFTEEHRAAAREIAAQTFVLLKNEGGVLPLKRKGKIALIGPLADAGNNMCGTWSVHARPEKHSSLLDAMRRATKGSADVLYARGSNIYGDSLMQANAVGTRQIEWCEDGELMMSEAIETARQADVIVAALGESADMSGESASRAEITIPDVQRELLWKLSELGKPVVLVLFTGRPLVLDRESKQISAILNVWFGGSEAADAITDVLFGDKSPCGKLTATFPLSVGQIPVYYNQLPSSHPDPQPGVFNRYSSNYIDIPNEPLYPFGYGLSYTTFRYGEPVISKSEIERGEKLTVSVPVTNTGGRDGVETVQLYIHDIVADIARPRKELKGFRRVGIKPGETVKVDFELTTEDLKYYNRDLEYKYDPGDFEVMVGPDSSNLQVLKFKVK